MKNNLYVPLICNKKVRKCVELWAELNGYSRLLLYTEGVNWGQIWCSFYEPLSQEKLLFYNQKCIKLQSNKYYTINELCGINE